MVIVLAKVIGVFSRPGHVQRVHSFYGRWFISGANCSSIEFDALYFGDNVKRIVHDVETQKNWQACFQMIVVFYDFKVNVVCSCSGT